MRRPSCRQRAPTQQPRPHHQVRPSRRSHHRVASSGCQPIRQAHPPHRHDAKTTCQPCRRARRSVPHRGRSSADPSYWHDARTKCPRCRRGPRSAGPLCRRDGTTRCRLFRRGLGCGARWLRRRRLLRDCGGRRRGGPGGVPARVPCRRWTGQPRRGCRRPGASVNPGRNPRPHPVACSREWTAGVRTAVWPGGTGRRPRTGIRWRRPRTVRPPRTGTRHYREVRTGVVRAGPVAGFPPQEWAGCRTATSARRRGSLSCVACTGCCRTRTLFRCSLHCLAPKTCLIIRLTGAPQDGPAR